MSKRRKSRELALQGLYYIELKYLKSVLKKFFPLTGLKAR